MSEHGGSRALAVIVLALSLAPVVRAQSDAQVPSPASVTVDNSHLELPALDRVVPVARTREEISATLKIFVIMTVLTLAPSIIIMTTSFTRILIVLGLLRQALGTQQLPPAQILIGLSLFLSFLVMGPTYEKIYNEAIGPWLNNAPGMTQEKAWRITEAHMRAFQQKRHIPATEQIRREDVSTSVLVPAFVLSELKTAFVMGFRIYLPFLVIDMVIATVLISMGMLMLPPVLISLPFKLLLFVLADGWHLVVASLLTGFAT